MAEPVTEIRGVPQYLSASIKDLPVEKRLARTHAGQEEAKKEGDIMLMKLEKLRVFDEEYQRLVESAKDDLRYLYKDAGVPDDQIIFPEVYLIPEAYVREFFPEDDDSVGGYHLLGNVCVLFVGKDTKIVAAGTLHHELNHSLGRKAIVTKLEKIEGKNKTVLTLGQEGLQTGGVLLEEGVVEYFSVDYVANCTDPVLRQVREEYLSAHPGTNLVELYSKGVYREAWKIIQSLVDRAGEAGGDDGRVEMERLLLAARIVPESKSRLVKKINELYGTKLLAKKLFRADLTPNDIKEVQDLMAM